VVFSFLRGHIDGLGRTNTDTDPASYTSDGAVIISQQRMMPFKSREGRTLHLRIGPRHQNALWGNDALHPDASGQGQAFNQIDKRNLPYETF
jgi:hypothetical protein